MKKDCRAKRVELCKEVHNENGNEVEDEEKATSCAIFEFDSNDNLINEATFIRSMQEHEKYIPKFDCGVDLILK